MDPLGGISLAQEHLRTMLAACASFRALCEVSTPSAALAKIHPEGLPEPANKVAYTVEELVGYRPHAIVYTDERGGFEKTAESFGNFDAAGRLKLRLERNCPATLDDEPTSEANLEWKNIVGQIIDELCTLSAAAASGHLAFRRIAVDYGPFWNAPQTVEDEGSWQGVELGIDWQGM